MRFTRRTLQIILVTVLLIVLVASGLYIWGREEVVAPSKDKYPTPTAVSPEEYCSPVGGICLTPPSAWYNSATGNTSMGIKPMNDKVLITYNYETPTKITPCAPGDCLLKVLSVEDFEAIPDTVLVKAINQRPKYGVNVPTEFLISVVSAQKYKLEAGKTSDLGEEAMPAFSRTVDGKTYTQTLEIVSYTPGNYDSPESAELWFDTTEARIAHDTITSLELVR